MRQNVAAQHTDSSIRVTDDAGHLVVLPRPAQRVVSLIPSATETIIALGATNHIVGRTRYDVAREVASKPSVGGGLDPSVEAIVGLRPDLVVAWSNDQRQEARTKLVALGIPVFVLRTEDTTDVFRGIAHLGHLIGRDSAATALSASIHGTLEDVRRSVAQRPSPTVLYVVFNDPPMTAGPKTFIGQMITLAGGRSIFADAHELWPTVSMEEIVRRNPDLLIVPMGEFRENAIERFRGRPGWRDLRAVREGHIVTVSADLVNRPGPHIGEAALALRDAMHPEVAAHAPRSSVVGKKSS